MQFGPQSQHPQEQQALNQIFEALKAMRERGEIALFSNLELVEPGAKTLHECDLVLIAPRLIAIVELKHWYGDIEVDDYSWRRDGALTRNPHKANNNKCRILVSWLKRTFPHVDKWPFVQSMVVLTHEDATVRFAKGALPEEGRQGPKTFASIAEFLRFVRQQVASPDQERFPLSTGTFGRVTSKLEEIAAEPKHFSTQIPGFFIRETLASSPLCTEFLAQPENPIDRSIKRLRYFGELAADPQQQEKQKRNLLILEKLPPHPHICRSHIVNAGSSLVEVSNWSDTGTLRDCLHSSKTLDPELAIRLGGHILLGLAHVHAGGVVHRSLSPENILLDGETAQLMNFELAYDPEAAHTVMDDAEAARQSPYRAPEIALKSPDFASDLYSFGVILFEMLTGKQPIASWQDLTKSNGVLALTTLDRLPLGTPNSIRELIAACVQTERSARPDVHKAYAMLMGTPQAGKSILVGSRNERLNPGDVFENWEIVRLIGQGATAQVYEATTAFERVALKIFNIEIPPEHCLRERRMIKRVESPNVVECKYNFHWEDGRQFLELELIEGMSFRELVDEARLPELETFRESAEQIFEALVAMHQAELDPGDRLPVIHNDLSPSNLIVGKRGIEIIDFGVASDPGIGCFCGHPAYVAPELVIDGELIRCEAGDMFTVAASLYEWLTGKHPFGGQLPGLVPAQPLPVELAMPHLADWFARALEIPRETRFESVLEMRDTFLAAIEADRCHTAALTQLETTIPKQEEPTAPTPLGLTDTVKNPCGTSIYVDYLNSLHNASASNENALAESQAINDFFCRIHVDIPEVTEKLEQLLKAPDDAVIILTGHAGDGKSTIALDLFKRLHGLPRDQKLSAPLRPEEVIPVADSTVTIVKDMSELSAEQRLTTLRAAVTKPGKWLIIANTGPLLETCAQLFEEQHRGTRHEIEDRLLGVLEQRIIGSIGDEHRLTAFDKPMWVANLTMLDNLAMVDKLLTKLLAADFWRDCAGCAASASCPMAANVRGLTGCPQAAERMTLVYRRLAAYQQRITARQMTAHLAFSLTAGLSCEAIREHAQHQPGLPTDFLVSNTFFGFEGKKPSQHGAALHAIRCLQALELGARPYPILERQLQSETTAKALLALPVLEEAYCELLAGANLRANSLGSRHRQQIRRMLFLFGDLGKMSEHFVDHFLLSPQLQSMERWLASDLKPFDRKELRDRTLRVLLEEFTGFKASQYASQNRTLYLTLKRETSRIPQHVQLVRARFPFDDFELTVDKKRREIRLRHRQASLDESLLLSLPLLDYIFLRNKGEVGENLDEIYLHQLEWFKSRLLGLRDDHEEGSLQFIQASPQGRLHICDLELQGSKVKVAYER